MARATDELIALIKDIHYFDFVDSRIHGSPESNLERPFWWSTWWTGISAKKSNGQVTYTHNNHGSDNAGIQTSYHLENACFAYKLTGDAKYAHMARRLMRGMSSWILASAKTTEDAPKVLFRAFYPESVSSTDGGRDLFINYGASRPGVNSGPSDYVHHPYHPNFGDIWLKNKRSIDDLGHMIKSIAHLKTCEDVFDGEAKTDLHQMIALYSGWADDVEANKFNIPTYNDKLEKMVIPKGLGDYNGIRLGGLVDPLCLGKLAVRFLHSDSTESFDCGNGFSFGEKLISKYLQNDAVEIMRSNHIAAVAMAEWKNQTALASKLREGLVERMNRDLKVARNPKLSPKYDTQDIATFLIQANNAGVPLTSNEIRFLYERLHQAYEGVRLPQFYNTFHLFDSSVPDGDYSYDPPHIGLYFYAIGSILGSCSTEYKNPNSRSIVDCERLKNELKN